MTGQRRLRVLITTNIPAPYMVDYCRELAGYCDLTVAFERRRASDRERDWYKDASTPDFRVVWLHALPFGAEEGFSPAILPLLRRSKFDRIIVANPTTPTGILELLYCRGRGIPFLIQSEGGFQGSGKGLKERFKRFLMERAQCYLTGMGGEDDYFLRYGAKREDLRPYPFTSLFDAEIDRALPTREEKQRLRARLGIGERTVILCVARFLPVKGYDTLLRACVGLDESVGVYCIGGSPDEQCGRIIEENAMTHVHALAFCGREEVKKYYRAADLFVLATRGDTWGLVINEAMAAGLPVITTDRCIAGTQLIENGKNGWLVPVDDPAALREKIDALLYSEALRREMGRESLARIRGYSIENMAKTVFGYLEACQAEGSS